MVQAAIDGYVATNGINLHYRDWGGDGKQVVLLHGLASSCHIWDLVAPQLAEDFSVIAVDQRGHGLSDKPESGYDFDSVGRDLLGVIRARNLDRPIIVGHSWGADVALEFAVAHPEMAAGICFVDGGMIEPSSRPGMTREKAREEMAPPQFAGMTSQALRERFHNRVRPFPLPPEFDQILFSNFEILEDGTVRTRLSRENHLRIIDALWEHYPTQLYPQVPCPVLMMPARMANDDSVSERTFRRQESVAKAHRLLPRVQVVWLEDSIHDVPVQRPDLVAETIRQGILSGFLE